MTMQNTFTFSAYYDLPCFDPEKGVRWVTHEATATVALPAHILTEDQASEYLHEKSMDWGHEHVRYDNFLLHDEDCDSEI